MNIDGKGWLDRSSAHQEVGSVSPSQLWLGRQTQGSQTCSRAGGGMLPDSHPELLPQLRDLCLGETGAAEATQGLIWTWSARRWGHCRFSFTVVMIRAVFQKDQEERKWANKDLKQHGGDWHKKGHKWKKSRVLSPSGDSPCCQIHAMTGTENLKAKHSTT